MHFLKLYSLERMPGDTDLIDFSSDIEILITRNDDDSRNRWQARVTSLKRFDWLGDANDSAFSFQREFVVKEYDEQLIKDEINRLIASCNNQAKSLAEASYCMMEFMEYEYRFGRYNPFTKEYGDPFTVESLDVLQESDPAPKRKKYILHALELTSGKPFVDDCENAFDTVRVVYKEADGDGIYVYNVNAATVGWIEEQVNKKPIIFLNNTFVMRYFDLKLLRREVESTRGETIWR